MSVSGDPQKVDMEGREVPHAPNLELQRVKHTIADSLSDALEVIQTASDDNATLSVDDYIALMEQRGVERSAAQDTLLFLRGTGEYGINAVGEIDVAP